MTLGAEVTSVSQTRATQVFDTQFSIFPFNLAEELDNLTNGFSMYLNLLYRPG